MFTINMYVTLDMWLMMALPMRVNRTRRLSSRDIVEKCPLDLLTREPIRELTKCHYESLLGFAREVSWDRKWKIKRMRGLGSGVGIVRQVTVGEQHEKLI